MDLEPQQSLVALKRVVSLPDAAHPRGVELGALHGKLVDDELRALGRKGQAEVEDGLLDPG